MRARLVLLVIAHLGTTSSAFAQDHACDTLAIDADDDLAERIRAEIASREDIDTCAHVKVVRRGPSIVVAVDLPDGRSTARVLDRREDVVSTVRALLLVPPPPPPTERTLADAPAPIEETEPEPRPIGRPAPSTSPPNDSPERRRDPKSRMQASNRLRLELSLLTGARVAEAQTIVGVGAVSFIDANGWLVGFAGRADHIEGKTAGPPGSALSLNILLGYRFRFGWLSLDLYGGPGATRGSSSDVEIVTLETSPPPGGGPASPGTALRGLIGARLSLRAESTFRIFAGLDADFGARGGAQGNTTRVGSTVQQAEFEPLPAFSMGLNLGATVGTL